MATFAESVSGSSSKAITIRGILKHAIRIYRADYLRLFALFLLPAAGRFLWTIAQRSVVHRRHPDWPQAGILVNSEWGLSIYWSTMILTCAGLMLYLILAGPALALTSHTVQVSMRDKNAVASPSLSIGALGGYLALQFFSAVRAWWIFIAGLMGTTVVGAKLLDTNPDQGFPVWYALVAITFLVGLPIGVWLSLRYFLVIPAGCSEGIGPSSAFWHSAMLTSGIRLRLLTAISAIVALRWGIGLLAGSSLGWLGHAHPEAATLSTFLLFPLTICFLDGLFGPLWGVSAALLYETRTISEQQLHETKS